MIKHLIILSLLNVELYCYTKEAFISNNIIYQPRSDIHDRYFVIQHGDIFRLVESCNEVRTMSSMARCLVKINHK